MKTKRLTQENIDEIIYIIKNEGLVAFPTDTVYGLAIRYDSTSAIRKLKEAKHRPEVKPFPMMVSGLTQIEEVANLTKRDYFLIERWMPGPITLVFNKKDSVDDTVTNGFKTIAIRMPDDDFVLSIIDGVGVPLLVPSANVSDQPPTNTHQEVLAQLDGKIDAVVCGRSQGGVSSTIIDTTQRELKILREGPITLDAILKSMEENK